MRKRARGSLSGRIQLWYMLAILLPTLLLSVLMYVSAYHRYLETILTDNDAIMTAIGENIENSASLVEHLAEVTAYDRALIDLLTNAHKSNYTRVTQVLFDVQEMVARDEVFLAPLGGDIVVFADADFVPESYWYILHTAAAEETPDYARFLATGKGRAWVGIAPIYPQSTVLSPSDNKQLLCYYCQIVDGVASRVGVVKCGVDPARVFSSAAAVDIDGTFSVVMDGQQIFGSEPLSKDILSALGETAVHRWHQGRLLLTRPLGAMGMTLVMNLDAGIIVQQAVMAAMSQLLIILGTGLVLLLATQRFMRSIRRRIDQAVEVARSAKTDLSVAPFPNSEKDEMGELIDAFNLLIVRLQGNARDLIRHEQQEKKVLRLALQYQMNPHFLFNTLNWIQMSIEVGADHELISEGIVLLGRLLRYNLEDTAFAPLSQEIERTQDYIRLMNMRKHDAITLSVEECNIDPQTELMRFMLQPLCENAIQHGLVAGSPLHILLRVTRDAGGITVVVRNDGAMIPQEKLRRLTGRIAKEEGENGIGLANIYSRLKLLYGDSSFLLIRSEECWTTITIRLLRLASAEKGTGIEHSDC